MTDRDYFAAAALTGLLAQGDDGSFSEASYVRAAHRWADAMLRERGVTEPMPQEKRAEVSVSLTDEEREAIAWCADRWHTPAATADTLRKLLVRFR